MQDFIARLQRNAAPPSIQDDPVRIVIPFKEQKSSDVVRRQLRGLGQLIGKQLQPIFVSTKIEQSFRVKEKKPALVNQQCVVYKFQCGLCEADYVGYTCRHLHQRIAEHKVSVIGKHVKETHGEDEEKIVTWFSILKKCKGKYDCLLYEMLFIKDLKPKLNKQSDSIPSKLF